jgi:hypothetical protein
MVSDKSTNVKDASATKYMLVLHRTPRRADGAVEQFFRIGNSGLKSCTMGTSYRCSIRSCSLT